jgi:predicted transcriptional regulator
MKPDFSPEKIECDNVLECLYNLSKLDNRILNILEKGEEYRCDDLAEELDRDQSTVYRALEKLVSCGMIYKEKKSIRKGGYYFLYSARPKDKIKEEALKCLEDWYTQMKKSIEKL